MNALEAHLVPPEAVADAIDKATAEEKQRTPAVHAVRPVRIDDGTVNAPVEALGHLVMAASQAAEYAALNSGQQQLTCWIWPRKSAPECGHRTPDHTTVRIGQHDLVEDLCARC